MFVYFLAGSCGENALVTAVILLTFLSTQKPQSEKSNDGRELSDNLKQKSQPRDN